MDKITYALESFKNIQDLIKFADQKSSAVLVVIGLVFTAFVQFIEKLTFSTSQITFIGVATFIVGIACILSMTIVLYYSIFKILKPRFAKNYQINEVSTFYFDHISKKSTEIHNVYKTLEEERMLKDIIDQQIEVSNILNEKNENLSKSFNWLFVALFSTIIFILLSIQL
jgi:hypothetical protein